MVVVKLMRQAMRPLAMGRILVIHGKSPFEAGVGVIRTYFAYSAVGQFLVFCTKDSA